MPDPSRADAQCRFRRTSEPRSLQASESVSRYRGFALLFADALNRQTFLQRLNSEEVVSAPIEQFVLSN